MAGACRVLDRKHQSDFLHDFRILLTLLLHKPSEKGGRTKEEKNDLPSPKELFYFLKFAMGEEYSGDMMEAERFESVLNGT